MGDDVVQLARDPGALAQHGRRLALGAVALDLAGLLVEAAVERVARAQHAAGEGRDADRNDRHPGDAARQVAGRALEQRGRREQADRRDGADDQVARRRAQPDQEDADHAQEDRDLGGVEQAAAQDRLEQEEQVDGEQARQRARHAKASGTGVRSAKASVTARTPGSSREGRLGELGEREERAASAASARSGSSARRETSVKARRPIPADGRPAPAGCRRPQG